VFASLACHHTPRHLNGVARHRRYPFELFKEEGEEVTHQPITLLDLFKFLPSTETSENLRASSRALLSRTK
jgi:hypothetical protein